MPLRWLAAFMLAVPLTAQAAERFQSSDSPSTSSMVNICREASLEPSESQLAVGDPAPGFTYLDPDGRWTRFAELGGGGPLLLVFGASDSDLVAIEGLRATFLELGVTPVAVMDSRGGSVKALQRRLAISGPIIIDPKRAIAGLFNSLDSRSLTHAPSFFVLDEKRRIRALGHGPLPSSFQMLTVSASSLGRPLPKSVWSRWSS
jgi:peroxiredoxin